MIIIILAITIVTLLAILVIDAIFTTQRTIIENQKEVNNQNLFDESYYHSNTYKKIEKQNDYNEDLEKYIAKECIMTKTEIKFYIELKRITDELNMTIFPQVDLERIIKVIDDNYRDRNKIKSRSIDYTIVKNNNYKIICCIELDDYSHNTKKAQKADNFKNELFEKVKIPLHRIKVNSYYDTEEIKKILQQDLLKN